jgi:hypothetical protein
VTSRPSRSRRQLSFTMQSPQTALNRISARIKESVEYVKCLPASDPQCHKWFLQMIQEEFVSVFWWQSPFPSFSNLNIKFDAHLLTLESGVRIPRTILSLLRVLKIEPKPTMKDLASISTDDPQIQSLPSYTEALTDNEDLGPNQWWLDPPLHSYSQYLLSKFFFEFL